MPDPERGTPKSVAIDGMPIGELFATFESGDDLVEQLRRRAAYVGISYGMIEHITGMAEGSVGKYLGTAQIKHLTCASIARIASVLGVRAVLIVDEELVHRYQRHWGGRDAGKAHNSGRQRRRAIIEAEASPQG